MDRKRGIRGTELLLLLVLFVLVVHFARARKQADFTAKEAREQATRESAVRLFEKLPAEAQSTIAELPTTLHTGITHGFESERILKARIELSMANRCLKKDPDNTQWLKTRAFAQGALGEVGLALQDLDRILNLDPNDHIALQLHSMYAAELGLREVFIDDLEKLENIYQKATGTVPAHMLKSRAYYLAEDGRFEEALVVARRADAIEPNDANTLDTLGNIYAGLGDHHAALEVYSRTAGLNLESVYPP